MKRYFVKMTPSLILTYSVEINNRSFDYYRSSFLEIFPENSYILFEGMSNTKYISIIYCKNCKKNKIPKLKCLAT